MLPCLGLYKGNLRPSNLASHVLSKFFFQRMEFVYNGNQYVANWHSDGTVLKRRWWYLQHGWMKITSLSKKDINSFGAGTLVELKWCVGSLCPTSDSQLIFKEIVISLTRGSRGDNVNKEDGDRKQKSLTREMCCIEFWEFIDMQDFPLNIRLNLL